LDSGQREHVGRRAGGDVLQPRAGRTGFAIGTMEPGQFELAAGRGRCRRFIRAAEVLREMFLRERAIRRRQTKGRLGDEARAFTAFLARRRRRDEILQDIRRRAGARRRLCECRPIRK
jgi:hypothetical protein